MQISFASAVSQLGLQLNSLGGSSVTFNLYDSLNNLLETQTLSSVGGYVPVTFSASGVSRIDGLQPSDGWAWAMDNLSFESSGAVPEPSTWALMLLGFGAVGFMMRRRCATHHLPQAA